jgi:hypothetical protein
MALRRSGMLLERVPEITRQRTQRSAGKRPCAPARRVERLRAMNWQIIAAEPPTHFVLPDCLAVGIEDARLPGNGALLAPERR